MSGTAGVERPEAVERAEVMVRMTFGPNNGIGFSPDGTLGVSGSVDETARIWDAATGREEAVLAGHRGVVADAAFTPDGTLVVTGSSDRDVRAWDAATGAPRARFNAGSGVTALTVSADGALVAATTTITARSWEIATGRPDLTVNGGYDCLTAVAFDLSGRCLASRPPIGRRRSGRSRPAFP